MSVAEAERATREAPTSSASSSYESFNQMHSPADAKSPVQFTTTSASVAAFCQRLVDHFFTCQLCHRAVEDPVQIMPDNIIACRRCAAEHSTISTTMGDLPGPLVAAVTEIMSRAGLPVNGTMLKENDVPPTRRHETPKGRGLNRSNNGSPRNGKSRDDAGAGTPPRRQRQPGGDSEDITSRAASPDKNNAAEDGRPRKGNENEEATPKASGTHSSSGSPASPGSVLSMLMLAEANERSQVAEAEASARSALLVKAQKVPRPTGPTSKTYKVEADKLYERGEYTAAVEYYTKAIQVADGTARPKFLYGNRSAANYMAGRYAECVEDCLKTFKLDPTNAKMLSRAAKSASVLGDLDQAIEILRECPPNLLTDAIAADLARFKQGAEVLKKAEASFGTPDGDEHFRMLVAQFRETVPFRMRLAESLMQQRRFRKATEVLDVLRSSSGAPPRAMLLLAECYYKSGFEFFESARTCLLEPAQYDDACAKLLDQIQRVNDGKHRGNMLFGSQKFAESVNYYTTAIAAAEGNDEVLRILYCNRAAAHKELDHFREGIEDCTKALSINKDFFKAYARRARCHRQLGDYFAAVQDFKSALRLEPNDADLKRELAEAERGLAKEAEREKEHYYQLGVARNATEREIKLKYRELSLRWHPDKCVGLSEVERERAEHKFKVINESYAVLMDPQQRRRYDDELDRKERFGRTTQFSSGFANTYNSQYFRGQRNTRSGGNGYW